MKPPFLSLAVLVLLAVQAANQGCTVTKNITLRSELKTPRATGPISLLTKDSSTYLLKTYTLIGQVLAGKGTVRKNGKEKEFDGELKLADIGYIKARETDVLKGLAAIGFTAAFVGVVGQSGGAASGLNVDAKIVYPSGGGSSCPFVYGWNGTAYTLEGEAFGVGLGSALELTTCTVLPSLAEDRGGVRIRLTNERAETHYVNSVAVVAVETPQGSTVYADGNGALWPVVHEVGANVAVDRDGNDISELVAHCDGRYWESDPGRTTQGTAYRDTIDLLVDVPRDVREGCIVVHAINTRLSEAAYGLVADLLGAESLEFLRAAEHDPEMIESLRQWVREAALNAYLWNGSGWDSLGRLLPEANSVPFAKVIRWKSGFRTHDALRLRFTSLHDVWKIDAFGFDASCASPLVQHALKMKSAEAADGADVSRRVTTSDHDYAVLVTGDRIDMTFDAWQPAPGNRVTYAADIRGYLYEWVPAERHEWAEMLCAALPTGSRLPLVKSLLRDRGALLPVIYSVTHRPASTAPAASQGFRR